MPSTALRCSMAKCPGGEALFLARPPEKSSHRWGLRSSGMPCLTRVLSALEGAVPGTEGSYSVTSAFSHFALAEVVRAAQDCKHRKALQPPTTCNVTLVCPFTLWRLATARRLL